jgi:protocatechuate 3,4-dioxygenase beta subunit
MQDNERKLAAPKRSAKAGIGRREALALIGATGAAFATACASDSPTSPSALAETTTTTTTGSATSTGAACAVTPNETVGPYPSLIDLFRSDIREGKSGTQLNLAITVVNTATSCAPLAGVNVEIWQCDATGNYSQYGSERAQTYLRGIQTTDDNGQVRFTTVYPGWYQGRATHIHVEVTRNGQSLKVTQIAFPESVNNEVYGSGVYASRGSNPTTNTRDGIFADSINSEMASVAGNPSSGYTATFTIGLTA